jgi:hypothetical protein
MTLKSDQLPHVSALLGHLQAIVHFAQRSSNDPILITIIKDIVKSCHVSLNQPNKDITIVF